MNKIKILVLAILAVLSLGISVFAQTPNRQASQPFEVANGLPVLEINSQKMPTIATHIRQAQATKPSTLTRITNKNEIDRNRENACGNFVRRKGIQCDEYPFASTREGGTGASTMGVPASEQRIQGGTISAFYRKNKLKNGSQFTVKVN